MSEMRIMYLGLVRLGLFKPKKECMRSMHLGLLHLGQIKSKKIKERHEKHAPGAPTPGTIQVTKSKEKECETCTWGN
jgi:hypothetical protein